MTLQSILFQALNGLASASGLFLVGAGLSLIFGVTRVINMAHGSLYMLGIYLAYTIATAVGGGLGYWGGIVLAALGVAAIGATIEMLLLRRIYHVPSCSSCSLPSPSCSSSTTQRCGCGARKTCSARAHRACAMPSRFSAAAFRATT